MIEMRQKEQPEALLTEDPFAISLSVAFPEADTGSPSYSWIV